MIPARDTRGSGTTRRLNVRLRPDLSIHTRIYGAKRYYLVQDPLARRYFHLGEEEHAILTMLDGASSLQEVKDRFERAHAPLRVTLEQLHTFVGHLHRLGLLLVDAPGRAKSCLGGDSGVFAWSGGRRWATYWLSVSRASIRNRCSAGFTPAAPACSRGGSSRPVWGWCSPRPSWQPSSSTSWSKSCPHRGPSSRQPTSCGWPWRWPWRRSCTSSDMRSHATHFGGECHEIGVLLLVFTPCLYCNVSDAWLLPSKWQRIAVSGAGIFVEIVLASLCLFLWWLSEPGLTNTLLLNVLVACSVNTLFLNGNPLLRYDGYYVLSGLAGSSQSEPAGAGLAQSRSSANLVRLEKAAGPLHL